MSEAESTLTQLLKESPFQQLFDLSCTRLERTKGEVEIVMGYTASVERSPGTRQYHGGAIASLIDIAGDYALWAPGTDHRWRIEADDNISVTRQVLGEGREVCRQSSSTGPHYHNRVGVLLQ